jgi:tRNA(fMet)-specific endonuclease VapC
MSGNRYFLDTNAIVALLKGNSALTVLIGEAEWIGVSIVSYIGFLSFDGLSGKDIELFTEFSRRIDVISLALSENDMVTRTVQLRKKHKIKLPDAVIVASSSFHGAMLLTADKVLLRIIEVKSRSF